MELQFNCSKCNSKVISKFLSMGEEFYHPECGGRTIIPEDAECTEEHIQSTASEQRNSNSQKRYKGCPHCDSIQNTDSRYCTQCGYELNPPELVIEMVCEKCGGKYSESKQYCPDDGTKLTKKEIEKSSASIKGKEKPQQTTTVKHTINDNEKGGKSKSKDLSMNWFGFYTYVRLPISLIASVYSLYIIGFESFYSLILVISIILYGTLIYYLDKKSIIGWDLNWIVLIFEILVYSFLRVALDPSNDTWLISIFVLSIIWFAPNYFYFMKRRYLFT